MKGCDTVEQVGELVVKEQLLNILPTDLQIYMTKKKLETALEARQLAYELGDKSRAARPGASHIGENHLCHGEETKPRCHTCGLP